MRFWASNICFVENRNKNELSNARKNLPRGMNLPDISLSCRKYSIPPSYPPALGKIYNQTGFLWFVFVILACKFVPWRTNHVNYVNFKVYVELKGIQREIRCSRSKNEF